MESDDFTGQGLFFNFRLALFVALGIIGLSCLWWAPFVWHLARPLLGMADYAERIAAEGNPGGVPPLPVNAARQDEIGRLSRALGTMTRRLNQQMAGQRQFIRHIAHELNSPLARTQIGLAILEERLEGNPKARVQRIMQDINRLSMLTDEVLSYLQAKASLGTPKNERIYLCPFLSSIVRSEAPEADDQRLRGQGRVAVDGQGLPAPGGVQRAAQRHHLRGGGGAHRRGSGRGAWGSAHFGPRQGPGVPEQDLPLLLEPFYRGKASLTHPGGSGLGLSIVKYCMEACGGRLEYANAEPSGFCVSLFFPKSKGPVFG